VTHGLQSSDVGIGGLSPDGNFVWDGAEWKSAVSPDGTWRWTGSAWVATFQLSAPPKPLPPFASPRSLGIWVSLLLAIDIAVAFVQVFVVDPYFTVTLTFGDQQFDYNISLGGLAALALTSVLFVAWFQHFYRNLVALGGRELQFTRNWAAAWWFIPIACLWMPYRVAHEIWKASDPSAAPTTDAHSRRQIGTSDLVWVWWAAWLSSLLLSNSAAVLVNGDAGVTWLVALSEAATVLAAVLAIIVITSVSARQDDRWRQLASVAVAAAAPPSQVVHP
jgi:hypothetical protein